MGAELVIKHYFDKAAFDAKDADSLCRTAIETAYARLKQAGISPSNLMTNDKCSSLIYCSTMLGERITREIDFQHPPGCVRIDGILIEDLTLLGRPEDLLDYIQEESVKKIDKLIEKLTPHIEIRRSVPALLPLEKRKPFILCPSHVLRELTYCHYEGGKFLQKKLDWRRDPEKIYLGNDPLPENKFPLLTSPALLQELRDQVFLDELRKHVHVFKTLPAQLAMGKPYLWEREVKGEPKMVMCSSCRSDGSIENLPIRRGIGRDKIQVGGKFFPSIESFLSDRFSYCRV